MTTPDIFWFLPSSGATSSGRHFRLLNTAAGHAHPLTSTSEAGRKS